MSTYTTSLGLERITPGDQPGLWGNTTNNNLNLIDQAITGVTPISFAALSGQTYTLTDFDGAVDEARSAVLNITGIAAGSNTVVIPNKQKTYLVRNNTGQNVVFQTPTPTATYTVGAGNSILIFCDGNNNVFTGIASPSVGTLGVAGGGTGATTFTAGFVKSTGGTNALTSSTTVDLASEVSGVLPVPRGGTGAGTFTSGSLLIGNGTGNFGTLVGGGVGQVATWNGSTWTAQTPTTGGITSISGSSTITANTSGSSVTLSQNSSQAIAALGYTPVPSNGVGATGTWPISISGSAASASTATTATNVSGGTGSITTLTVSGRASIGGGSAGGNFNLDVAGQANQTVAFFTTTGSGGTGITINCTGGTSSAIIFQNNGATTGQIVCTPSGTSYNSASDRRLKEDITTLTNSGSVIDALQPRTFKWKSTGETASGFIADELQHVVPTAVSGQPNAIDAEGKPIYQLVDCSTPEMIALMIAELQSLRKRVAELEAK